MASIKGFLSLSFNLPYINIQVPSRMPEPPPEYACCGSGCANCVWLQYGQELIDYYSMLPVLLSANSINLRPSKQGEGTTRTGEAGSRPEYPSLRPLRAQNQMEVTLIILLCTDRVDQIINNY